MKKCEVIGCENTDEQGGFHGSLCMPCYDYVANNKGNHSQAQRNEEQIFKLRKYYCGNPIRRNMNG